MADGVGAEVRMFPIVEPAGDGSGDEGRVEELIADDFYGDYLECWFRAEDKCLGSVKCIHKATHAAPEWDGKKKIGEVFPKDTGFLKNDDT